MPSAKPRSPTGAPDAAENIASSRPYSTRTYVLPSYVWRAISFPTGAPDDPKRPSANAATMATTARAHTARAQCHQAVPNPTPAGGAGRAGGADAGSAGSALDATGGAGRAGGADAGSAGGALAAAGGADAGGVGAGGVGVGGVGVGAAPGMGKMSAASEPRTSKSTLMPAAGTASSPCHSSRVKAYRFPSSPRMRSRARPALSITPCTRTLLLPEPPPVIHYLEGSRHGS